VATERREVVERTASGTFTAHGRFSANVAFNRPNDIENQIETLFTRMTIVRLAPNISAKTETSRQFDSDSTTMHETSASNISERKPIVKTALSRHD
jgi:hypothetical protein